MSEPPVKKEKESTTITLVVRRFNPGETEQFSPMKRINGYPWRLRLSREEENLVDLSVICDKSNEADLWQCSADLKYDRGYRHEFVSWKNKTHTRSIGLYDRFTIGTRLDVEIIPDNDGKCWRYRRVLDDFDELDGVLVIGDEKKKISVSKWFLSRLSPFFHRRFNEDFKEINEIAITDVVYEDFSNIIEMACGNRKISLTDDNVHSYMELADRFKFKIIEDKIVSYLLSSSTSLSFQQKLLISDKFNISFLKNILFGRRISEDQLMQLCKSPEWEGLSRDTIRVLFEKTSDRSWANEKFPPIPTKENNESNTISMVVAEWKEYQREQLSQVTRINGYPWRLRVSDRGLVELICDKSSEAALWKCTASFKKEGEKMEQKYCFASWKGNGNNKEIVSRYNEKNIKVFIETLEDGDSWRLHPVHDQFGPRDGILVIGEEKKKLYVNKESLAKASPFFDRLFNEDSKEHILSGYTIGDVDYEELCNLIRIAYRFDGASLTDDNVHRILQLANKFELKIVEDSVISFLLSPCSSLSLQKKLLISEQYELPSFKESLLNHLHSRKVLKELCNPIEWNQLPNHTIRVLFEKLCTRLYD